MPNDAMTFASDIAEGRAREDLIATPGKGWSKRLKVRDMHGRFNWDEPPMYSAFVGSGKVPMHLFVSDQGDKFYIRLEKSKQGGKWENAWHAESDWEHMKRYPQYIEEMWGTGPVSETLQQAVLEGVSFKEMKRRLKGLHTWRSISED